MDEINGAATDVAAADDIPAMTSTQKLAYLAEQLESYPGEGQMAMLLEVGRVALPMIRPMIPEDPRELDEMLEQVGEFLRGLKSDPGSL